MKLSRIPGKIYTEIAYGYDELVRIIMRPLFARCGKNLKFYPTKSYFNYKNISVGDNVYIGRGAFMLAQLSHIYIHDNTAIGPYVTVIGGDHRFDIPGKPITAYRDEDKLPENDRDVIIGEDVWIGSNVTILKGVTIPRGTIVAAGAVVTRTPPAYSIIAGIPARVIGSRFDEAQAAEHERIMREEMVRR